MKIDRMIGILSILLQHKKVTAPYLAEIFEVSRRTINRDIETLCQAGIPLMTTQGQNGGISIMEGYKIDHTLLTSAEMQSILTGLRSLDTISGTNRYAQLMEKLSAGSRNLLAGDSHILIDLSSWSKETLTPKFEQIHKAIEGEKEVSFSYFAPQKESQRTVEPYFLIFQWSSWYVWGWCTLRRDFRLFKLNRMTDLRIGKSFARRPVPMPDLSQKKIFSYGYPIKAVFDPKHKWRLIEECGADSFTQLPDGRLLLTSGFPDAESIVRWIVSFGSGAELLEPAKLRQNIVTLIEEIRNMYSDSHDKTS